MQFSFLIVTKATSFRSSCFTANRLFASAIQQSITWATCLSTDSLNLSSVTLGLGILVFSPNWCFIYYITNSVWACYPSPPCGRLLLGGTALIVLGRSVVQNCWNPWLGQNENINKNRPWMIFACGKTALHWMLRLVITFPWIIEISVLYLNVQYCTILYHIFLHDVSLAMVTGDISNVTVGQWEDLNNP